MSNDRPALIGSAFEAMAKAGEVVTDAGEWLTDTSGEATSFLGRQVRAATRSMCAAVSNGADFVLDLTPAATQGVFDLCTPYWDEQGSGPPSLSGGSPPFTGGQCAGTLYQVSGTYVASCFFDQVFNWSAVIYGPVEGVTFFQDDPVNGWAVKGRNSSGAVAYSNCTQTGSSNAVSVIPRSGVTCGQAFPGGVGQNAAASAPVITSVTALSGPDNCGDPPTPPPTLTPNPNPLPDPGYDPGDEPFVDPTGRPVIPLPPITDPFGRPIPLPNIKLPDFGLPNPFGDEPLDGQPGTPGEPEDTEPGGTVDTCKPGSELVGVLVQVLDAPPFARKIETPTENLYIGAVYVYVGLPGRLDLQDEGRLLRSSQFFYAQQPASCYRVVASPGYNLRVTPYYVERVEEI